MNENEKGMVDLLNQEMNELQAHQKQIEEMAKIIRSAKIQCRENYCGECEYVNKSGSICDSIFIADILFNGGYSKIPENAVVLTREEFWELSNKFSKKELDEIVEFHKNKTRKETVEKFAERWKKMAYQSTDWSHGEHPMVVEVDYIDEICEEITEGQGNW